MTTTSTTTFEKELNLLHINNKKEKEAYVIPEINYAEEYANYQMLREQRAEKDQALNIVDGMAYCLAAAGSIIWWSILNCGSFPQPFATLNSSVIFIICVVANIVIMKSITRPVKAQIFKKK